MERRILLRLLLVCAALTRTAAAQPAAGGAPSACFPVDDLEPADRQAAEEPFLKILDSEALFTVASGFKPMSSGFVSFNRDAAATENPEVDRAAVVRTWLPPSTTSPGSIPTTRPSNWNVRSRE